MAAAPAPDPDWLAPDAERARVNPVAPSPDALARGRTLYMSHCALCHGDLGKGDGPAAPYGKRPPRDLSDPALQARLTDGEILWNLTEGRQEGADVVMPAFREKVPLLADRWKLVLLVRALRAR